MNKLLTVSFLCFSNKRVLDCLFTPQANISLVDSVHHCGPVWVCLVGRPSSPGFQDDPQRVCCRRKRPHHSVHFVQCRDEVGIN